MRLFLAVIVVGSFSKPYFFTKSYSLERCFPGANVFMIADNDNNYPVGKFGKICQDPKIN